MVTDGKLKSTVHRVLDIGRERYSSPYFFEPKFTARIPKSMFNSKQDV